MTCIVSIAIYPTIILMASVILTTEKLHVELGYNQYYVVTALYSVTLV